MEQKFCQSCGMPMSKEMMGTNADGSLNEDYCIYCYKDGEFTQECSMDEMIEFCAQFVDEVNKNVPEPMTKEQYKQMMYAFFPQLKRWKIFLFGTLCQSFGIALVVKSSLGTSPISSVPYAFSLIKPLTLSSVAETIFGVFCN